MSAKDLIVSLLLMASSTGLLAQGNLCSSATTLPINGSCTNSASSITSSNTASGQTPNCFGNYKDIWYKFTGTGGQVTVKYTPSAGTDAQLQVYYGTCASLTSYDCADVNGNGQPEVIIVENSNPSLTYYVRVTRYLGGNMSGNICAWGGTQTVANTCSTAPTINAGSSIIYSTNQSATAGQPTTAPSITQFSCNGSIDNLVYYKVNTGQNGGTVSVTFNEVNCWYNDGLQVGLFLPTTACNTAADWNTSLFCNTVAANSSTTLNWTGLAANTTYYLIIDGYASDVCGWLMTFSGVLPIELASFDGMKYNAHNLLLWQTFSEFNNDYFSVERSADCITYESIAKISGAGNSTFPIKYKFLDQTVENNSYYYRLKQVDYDGGYSYSTIIYIKRELKDAYIKPIRVVNLLGQEVPLDYDGPRFILYEDGTYMRKN